MQSEIDDHLQLLEIYKRRLADLLRQQAIHGAANTPSAITFSIRECRDNINSIIKELKNLDPDTFQDLAAITMSENEDHILIDHVVNELSAAYKRYVASVKEKIEEVKQKRIESFGMGTISKLLMNHDGMIAVKKKINYSLDIYPELLVEQTENQRSVFISEISLILLKSGLPPLNDRQISEIKSLLMPVGESAESYNDQGDSRRFFETIFTGVMGGALAGSVIPIIGTGAGAIAGFFGSTFYQNKSQIERILDFFRREIERVTDKVADKVQEAEFTVINALVRHCIVR